MTTPPDKGRESPARVFFALWPDEVVVQRLHQLSGEAHAMSRGRRTRRDTLHLTLAFIGDVARDRLPDLIEVGSRVSASAFTLRVDLLAGWRHNRIVWAGASGVPEALTRLVESLNHALDKAGFPVEQRKFSPHITLVRKAEAEVSRRELAAPIDWNVRDFSLMESVRGQEGARYVPLQTWPADNKGGNSAGVDLE